MQDVLSRRATVTSSESDLQVRRNAAVPRGVVSATPFFAADARNAEIHDTMGRRFIDFASGIGVLATGHRHPRVIAAASEQLGLYTHTAFQVMAYEPYIELAERLNAIAPFRGPAKTLLLTTGAEAVENAVKIARVATGRRATIAFTGGFHGRSMMALALTGKVAPYKRGMGPFSAGEVYHLPFPIAHRGVTVDMTMAALDALFYAEIEPTQIAAIILEPVQGEGGFHVAPPELLRRLREVCDLHGILLISDEIQSGYGRTGRMFAIEHSGVEPDLVTVAKSLAGGFPLAAVLGRASVMDQVAPGGLGGTYAGSPVACAAALAVLDVISEEKLLARATAIGDHLRARLGRMVAETGGRLIANLRGLGAMLAVDVVSPDGKPDGARAKAIAAAALERGLIVLTCGTYGETLRFLVPLTVSDATLDEGLDILHAVVSAARA
jgi:4-aminobutyrate aminotransferase / (S)-3-amino-2-methylpropionate transaminase / 5-aminovalerate transaminase